MTRRTSETFLGFWACLLIFTAQAAVADDPTPPQVFKRLTYGKTFDFSSNGFVYGRETYLPGNRVIWDDLSGIQCGHGIWYAQDNQICFEYDHDPGVPKCWHFFEGDGGEHLLEYVSPGEDDGDYRMIETDGGMMCPNPFIGA